MAIASIELVLPEVQAPGARSVLYKTLSSVFRSPGSPFWQQLASGQLAAALAETAAALPYQLQLAGALSLGQGVELQALESAYLALFEVGGAGGSPCYLYEGEYGGGRMAVLDEVLRFYHYFGLRLNRGQRERPDHVATELEFMHALTFREAAARASGADPTPVRRAQHDFLRLHLEPFVSAIAAKLAETHEPFYPSLSQWVASFCQAEVAYLGNGA